MKLSFIPSVQKKNYFQSYTSFSIFFTLVTVSLAKIPYLQISIKLKEEKKKTTRWVLEMKTKLSGFI